MGKYLREPRALWDTGRMFPDIFGVTPTPLRRLRLDSDRFRNGSRHTLVLQSLSIGAPTMMRFENRLFPAGNTRRTSLAILDVFRLFVSAPGRKHFSRYDIEPWVLGYEGLGEPPMFHSGTAYAANLFGIGARWDFDFDFELPRKANIQFDLSGWQQAGIGDTDNQTAFMSVLFDEEGGGGASGRLFERRAFFGVRDTAGPTRTFPAGPVPIDGVGDLWAEGAGPAFVGVEEAWPGEHHFPSDEYRRQESQRGGASSRITGYSVLIDQIDFDEDVASDFAASAIGADTRIAPISMRTITRAKTRGGGSGEWWWRPGCPLALVSPTFTPAYVHRFDKPIVLGPGESLEVEIQYEDQTVDGTVTSTQPTFAVSFNGYAEIEG